MENLGIIKGGFKMRIINQCNANDCENQRTIYTVKLSDNRFVDVMHKVNANEDLMYVMQNEDGTCVFDLDLNTFDTPIDENNIIAFVKENQ